MSAYPLHIYKATCMYKSCWSMHTLSITETNNILPVNAVYAQCLGRQMLPVPMDKVIN